MADDLSDIIARYNADPQEEHERLQRHQLELDLTWRYLKSYLPKHGNILEVGAATGRYTLELAKLGYQVTAVDIAAALLAENKKNLEGSGVSEQVEWVVADARDLSSLQEKEFDVVLLMGPLYHLVEAADRRKAIAQACRHLKKGGLLISSFISRFGIMADLIKKDPEWITKHEDVQSIVQRGRDLEDYPKGGFRGYFCDPAEIGPMFSEFDLEPLVLAAVEPCIAADDESYNGLPEELKKQWLDLFFELSSQSSLLGASRHLLYVGKK